MYKPHTYNHVALAKCPCLSSPSCPWDCWSVGCSGVTVTSCSAGKVQRSPEAETRSLYGFVLITPYSSICECIVYPERIRQHNISQNLSWRTNPFPESIACLEVIRAWDNILDRDVWERCHI